VLLYKHDGGWFLAEAKLTKPRELVDPGSDIPVKSTVASAEMVFRVAGFSTELKDGL